jgi:hypothetical protein
VDHLPTRRQVVQSMGAVGLGLLVGCGVLPSQSQRAANIPRLGYRIFGRSGPSQGDHAFRQGLAELGYVEGAIWASSADLRSRPSGCRTSRPNWSVCRWWSSLRPAGGQRGQGRDHHDPYRYSQQWRSRGAGVRYQPGAAGWEYHGADYAVVVGDRPEAVAMAQGDRARGLARNPATALFTHTCTVGETPRP